MKRILSVLTAVAFIAALMATSAYAQVLNEDSNEPATTLEDWCVDGAGNVYYCGPGPSDWCKVKSPATPATMHDWYYCGS
jgi:hypothetical protein